MNRFPLAIALLLVLWPIGNAQAQPPLIEEVRNEVYRALDRRQDELIRLSDRIWEYAEISLQESRSAEALASFLEIEGFTVTRGVAGMPTAFVARWGHGHPVIGILAEYDALPGISNLAEAHQQPLEPGGHGHGCGHNIFGAASVGAAVAARQVLEARGLAGTIVLFGCPAEETVIGKVYMAKAGVFDGLDLCLDWHPSDRTGVDYSRTRALNNFTVEFFGRTAHAASDPWNGRSALDAVEVMNVAVNLLREHVSPSVRIHYVISDGGAAPNVVPDYARVWYYVRDLEREGVEEVYRRVLLAAEGAALATETTHRVRLTTGVHSYLLNRPLTELLDRNLRAAGPPVWNQEEQSFARTIQQAVDKPQEGLHNIIEPMPEQERPAGGGSTDAAEVSRIVPTAKFRVASSPLEAPWHAWPVVACSGSSIGHKAMLTAARTLGGAVVELVLSPEIVQQAQQEFETRTIGQPYRSPIPIDQPPPLPPPGS